MYISHEDNFLPHSQSDNISRESSSLANYLSLLEDDLNLLEKLVSTPSQSKNADDVLQVQKILARELEFLGFAISWVKPVGRVGCPLLHATKKGLSERGMSFVGHADTVLGPNSHFDFKYDQENMRILGPGVADDKGGLVVALRGIRLYLENNPKHFYTLNFISSPNEEVGSLGFHDFFSMMGGNSDYVFGFEPALHDGSLVSHRNGNAWYKLDVVGKSAHAGRFGEVSINAAHEISRIILSLHGLNDIENKVKVNVGTITGGTGHFNVVCGEASALIDMRFPSEEARLRLHSEFCRLTQKAQIKCFESDQVGSISYSIEDNCPALAITPKGEALAMLFTGLISKYEKTKVRAQHTGGAADVNYFFTENTAIIDGLGPIGGGLHTIHEYVELSSIYTRSETLREVLVELNQP